MKYLIVNADDLGASHGINRGIIECHRHGIVTSASLMVNTPFSEEAAKFARAVWHLSVGLHVDLPEATTSSAAGSAQRAHEELKKQFNRFLELMRQPPTHLDSHHNVHRNPELLPEFVALAAEHGLPLREHSHVRYFPSFYGQWNGESHPEQVSVENLSRILETEIGEGVTELACHPGYAESDYAGSYRAEREVELHTFCDPAIRRRLDALRIVLTNYHDLNHQFAPVGVAA